MNVATVEAPEIEAPEVPEAEYGEEFAGEDFGPETADDTITNETAPVADKVFMLLVDLRSIGSTKKIDRERVDTQADRSRVNVSKRILKSKELSAIGNHDEKLKQFLSEKTLPRLGKRGMYMLPVGLYEEVMRFLYSWQRERRELINEFAAEYVNLVREDRKALLDDDLFDVEDYLAIELDEDGEVQGASGCYEIIRACFTEDWDCVTFGVPDLAKEINLNLFEQERERQRAQWLEMSQYAQHALTERITELFKTVADKLRPDEDGNPKVFSAPLRSKVQELFNDFNALNITNDKELESVIERGKKLLEGVDAATIRKQPDLREDLRVGFDELEQQLAQMIVKKPKRGIKFA